MSPSRPILRLFFINWMVGILLGCLFAAAMVLFNIGGIGSLIARSDMAIPATILLFAGFSITCGGVVCASAVMRLAQDEGRPDAGAPEMAEALPAQVAARRR